MQSTKTRVTAETLPSVSGTVRVVTPVCTETRQGRIAINGYEYTLCCLNHGYQLITTDQDTRLPKAYDLPADLSACECMDYLTRSSRRTDGQCKHQKALAALVTLGKVPNIQTDPIQHANWDDADNECYTAATDDRAEDYAA